MRSLVNLLFRREKKTFSPPRIYYLFLALRPQQWVKNLFLFAPLLFALEFNNFTALFRTLIAFVLFTAAASGVYLLNDYFDLEQDRLHPKKKNRPLAAGKISIPLAWTTSIFLLSSSLILSFLWSPALAAVIFIYISVNILYSRGLKEMVIVDAMSFSLFFILRLLAGALVNKILLSHWIIICTGLLSLLIAFGKRYQELKHLGRKAAAHRQVLGKYSANFLEQLMTITVTSLIVAYTLYTVDQRTVHFFGSPILLLTVPFVYYGVFRYLYNVYELQRGAEPVEILFQDRKMQLALLFWILSVIIGLYFLRQSVPWLT